MLLSPRCFRRHYETWPWACRFPFGVNGPFQEKVAGKSFLTNYGKISHRERWESSSGLRCPSHHNGWNKTPQPTAPNTTRLSQLPPRRNKNTNILVPTTGKEHHNLCKRFRVFSVDIKSLKSEGCFTGSVMKALVDPGHVPRSWRSSLGWHQGASLIFTPLFWVIFKAPTRGSRHFRNNLKRALTSGSFSVSLWERLFPRLWEDGGMQEGIALWYPKSHIIRCVPG